MVRSKFHTIVESKFQTMTFVELFEITKEVTK